MLTRLASLLCFHHLPCFGRAQCEESLTLCMAKENVDKQGSSFDPRSLSRMTFDYEMSDPGSPRSEGVRMPSDKEQASLACGDELTALGVQSNLLEICRNVRKMRQDTENVLTRVNRVKAAQGEWRNVALVLDRLFFVIYVILILVSLTMLFPRPT